MRRESERSLSDKNTELLAVHSLVTAIGLGWTD